MTKIGKLSVFNGLNNLNDISMESGYSDICGISDSDLHRYFGESTKELAAANGMTEEQCYSKLAEMYDGYHFCRKSNGMYNPFSLLNTFKKMEFSEYWFETGTPTFLVKLLKRTDYDIRRIADADVEIDIDMISGVNDYINDPIPVLYQSGYLTIRSFDEMFGIYRLGFPNMEVRKGERICQTVRRRLPQTVQNRRLFLQRKPPDRRLENSGLRSIRQGPPAKVQGCQDIHEIKAAE